MTYTIGKIAFGPTREPTRRNVAIAAMALPVAGCGMFGPSGPDIGTIVKDITALIQQVQSGVASACAAVGKFVPTVDTVLQIIEGLLGSQITTANIAAAIALAQGAIDTIVKVGCPAPAAGARAERPSANVNGKTIPVIFY
jgi:S1-C subfamily serine protease